MEQRHRCRGISLLAIVLVTLLIPTQAASENTMFYVEAMHIEDAQSGKKTIELDSDGNIYASFGNILYKFDAIGNILSERTFSTEILATSLAPDSTRLALTIRGSTTGEHSTFILSSGDLSTLVSSSATSSNAHLLDWSQNGASIFTNGPEQGLIQLGRDTLEIDKTYSGNHTTSLVCFDVSSETGHILTIDQDGLILLWNISTEEVVLEFQLVSTIHDCQIGIFEDSFSVSTAENGIRKWTFEGSELKPIEINHVVSFDDPLAPNTIIVHTEAPTPKIMVYDTINEVSVQEIFLFHQFDDHVLLFDDTGLLEGLYTNSNAMHIVAYSDHVERVGMGQSGTDTDGDGIPDSLDSDDDGDGIEDNWDLNCQDIGISCELLPDEAYIRAIDMRVNETHIVMKQSFTLNKEQSANIRDLSRLSMDNDVRLTESEAQLFADSICMNMNEFELLESLSSFISIGNASIEAEEMTCRVEEGMVLTPASDRQSHIRYSISSVYALSPNQNLDQILLTVNNHRFPSTGSITELSDQHPMRITLSGESIVQQSYVPWHIQESQVSFTLELIEDGDDEISPRQILNSPIFIGLILIGILGVGLVIQWIYNQYMNTAYDISLEDDDEDDVDEDWSNDDDDDFEENTIEPEMDDEVTPPLRRTAQPRERTKSKRVRVEKKQLNEAEKLLNEASTEVVRKRRARRTAEQPTRTKRRKLSDSSSPEPATKKRRVVKKDHDHDKEMDDTLKRFVSDSPKE
tara:strand:- start:34741 stop:36975 length:2235 start_codon:yes stop_codon:yes gene_type:complete